MKIEVEYSILIASRERAVIKKQIEDYGYICNHNRPNGDFQLSLECIDDIYLIKLITKKEKCYEYIINNYDIILTNYVIFIIPNKKFNKKDLIASLKEYGHKRVNIEINSSKIEIITDKKQLYEDIIIYIYPELVIKYY